MVAAQLSDHFPEAREATRKPSLELQVVYGEMTDYFYLLIVISTSVVLFIVRTISWHLQAFLWSMNLLLKAIMWGCWLNTKEIIHLLIERKLVIAICFEHHGRPLWLTIVHTLLRTLSTREKILPSSHSDTSWSCFPLKSLLYCSMAKHHNCWNNWDGELFYTDKLIIH